MAEENVMEKNFEFLRNIIREKSTIKNKVDLKKVEDLIKEKIPNIFKENAPPNFHIIFDDFNAEYEKFKDYILFDKLIGKNVVALGGGFSSGKSSFLNSLMTKGNSILPVDNAPSTSVPTFIVKGEGFKLSGINVFDAKFSIEDVLMIRNIAHGFGSTEDSKKDVVTLGHIIESMFFETKLHKYEHIAFLDTPGYSKADSLNYSKKTDENIARRQLNTANYILWFIQADAGTITENDIEFLKTINNNIPKLVILNKADLKTQKDLELIVKNIKDTIKLKGIECIEVFAYSSNSEKEFDKVKILEVLSSWDMPNIKNNFATNFKKLFIQCGEFYDEEIEEEQKQIRALNKALTFSDDVDVKTSISRVLKMMTQNLIELQQIKESLKEVETEFFTEIKIVGDIVNIPMPEPSKLDLFEGEGNNPLSVVREYMKKKNLKENEEITEMLDNMFSGGAVKINSSLGGSDFKESIKETLIEELNVDFSRKKKSSFFEIMSDSFEENTKG